jgi:tetratricopeptide (TPR) repeat protein
MLDPISLSAITALLGAVAMGTAGEAGKWLWQSTGGLVQRILGRQVPAPSSRGQLEEMARQLHEEMRRNPEFAREWAAFARTVPTSTGVRCTPRLPAATRAFTDRRKVLKALDAEASRRPDGRPRAVLLYGPRGIGTSAAGLFWGNREAARRFPDGQVYVDLRSGPGAGMSAGAVLREMLRQLDVPQEETPPSEEHLAACFRRCVAELRLLVVLDHVTSLAQVRHLLAPAPGVVTLLSSPDPLFGLEILRIPVEPLGDRDARRLLVGVAGESAVDAARDRVPGIIARSAGNPFALRAAAPRLAHVPLPRTEATMTESDAVRTAVEDSYRTLDPLTARIYRLTALRPWPGCTAELAGWAANVSADRAARALDTLAGLQLLDITPAGRYHYRPAVRAHAEQAAFREDGIAVCSAAVRRVLNGFLDFAEPAAHAALPTSWRSPRPTDADARPGRQNPGDAVAALASEAGNLAEAVAAAAEFGHHDTVYRLVRALWPLQLKAGHLETLLPALRTGAHTADTHAPGTRTAAMMHAHLGFALTALERHEEAETALRAAARDEATAGHARGQASAVEGLGLLRLAQWRWAEAYELFAQAAELYATIGPDDDGAADLPRARALLARHRGRALAGLGRLDEGRELLGEAVRFFRTFRSGGDLYNAARALTDLARTHVDGTRSASAEDRAAALPLIDEAITILEKEQAEVHLAYLRRLRELCVTPE